MRKPSPLHSIFAPCLICLLLTIGACGEESRLKSLEKNSVRDGVTTMLHAYHDAIRDRGLLAEFEYLDNSADFFWVPPGYGSALSYDSVKVILEQSARNIISADYRWDSLTVFPIVPFLANFHGVVSGQVVEAGGVTRRVRMIESGTVILRAGGWKLLSGQTSMLTDSSDSGQGQTATQPSMGMPADSLSQSQRDSIEFRDRLPDDAAPADTVSGEFI